MPLSNESNISISARNLHLVPRQSGWKWLYCILFLILSGESYAAVVKGVRMWAGPEETRVVLDVSQHVEHEVFVLRAPDRVVIDLKNSILLQPPTGIDYSHSLLKGIRSAAREDANLRIVLDLKTAVSPKSFLLKPTKGYGHRLVVDLKSRSPQHTQKAHKIRKIPPYNKEDPRAVVVAIDAGHGGEDPGALGAKGTREKDVVLAIAEKFAHLVSNEWGMRPVLVRSGDYYISLRERVNKVRENKADIFISIHADAFRNKRAKGASVYVLSQKGASSEAARWLAASENNSDLIGGVSLDDKDDLLASVLLDLSQNATIAASMDIGDKVLNELERLGTVHKDKVEQAGFVVLKSPDVPSILVETGFISNPGEEAKLKSDHYQNKVARALLKGVRNYFKHNPPPGTLFAERRPKIRHAAPSENWKYVIKRGDTLSSIARRYQVSQYQLIRLNHLRNDDNLQIGQVLVIPLSDG